MITVIDYKVGNIHSVMNALKHIGADATVSSDISDIRRADKLILPGVGAFPDAVVALRETRLFDEIIKECQDGKPLLGICLGMQLLFEESLEFGKTKGLGLIPGCVVPIDAHGLKIPHMGWNSLTNHLEDKLIDGVREGDYVYFVHSFRADTNDENIVSSTFYGEKIPAIVKSPGLNVWGAQFHPEKSQDVGLKMFKNFADIK